MENQLRLYKAAFDTFVGDRAVTMVDDFAIVKYDCRSIKRGVYNFRDGADKISVGFHDRDEGALKIVIEVGVDAVITVRFCGGYYTGIRVNNHRKYEIFTNTNEIRRYTIGANGRARHDGPFEPFMSANMVHTDEWLICGNVAVALNRATHALLLETGEFKLRIGWEHDMSFSVEGRRFTRDGEHIVEVK
jgi:hypothetical protein